jgi:beta-mannanase
MVVVVLAPVLVIGLILLWSATATRGVPAEQGADQDPRSVPYDARKSHPRSIALGAYIFGAPEDSAKIDEFANMVGKQPPVVMWYQDWATPGVKEFDRVRMDAVVARGAMPMITWEPADWTQRTDQPRYALREIVNGTYDNHVRGWARDAAAWGKPFYLRFAHEMNSNWYPWCPGVNGNAGAAEYVAAWRRVHNIFEEEGATNVRWVWSPNVWGPNVGNSTPPAKLYPGGAYVDWVGLDGYNWGTSQPGNSWQTFSGIFGHSYDKLARMTKKPMMISETASAELGGAKAAWIRQGLLVQVPKRFPRIKAVIWFHRNNVAYGQADWRVNSSKAALKAYREVVASPLYQGRLR